MKKINAKDLREKYYFVLYDMNDYPICYFDNFDELKQHLNYPLKKINYMLNIYGNLIHIKIGDKLYKLFATNELENF